VGLSDKTATSNGTGFCGQLKKIYIPLDLYCCGPIFLLKVLDFLFRYIA